MTFSLGRRRTPAEGNPCKEGLSWIRGQCQDPLLLQEAQRAGACCSGPRFEDSYRFVRSRKTPIASGRYRSGTGPR
jgi:hypothetical protein